MLMLAPRLPLLYEERITPSLLHHILLHAAREPGMLPISKLSVESAANDLTKVRLLALSYPESGAWLNALPLSSIGLRMDDDVIRILYI